MAAQNGAGGVVLGLDANGDYNIPLVRLFDLSGRALAMKRNELNATTDMLEQCNYAPEVLDSFDFQYTVYGGATPTNVFCANVNEFRAQFEAYKQQLRDPMFVIMTRKMDLCIRGCMAYFGGYATNSIQTAGVIAKVSSAFKDRINRVASVDIVNVESEFVTRVLKTLPCTLMNEDNIKAIDAMGDEFEKVSEEFEFFTKFIVSMASSDNSEVLMLTRQLKQKAVIVANMVVKTNIAKQSTITALTRKLASTEEELSQALMGSTNGSSVLLEACENVKEATGNVDFVGEETSPAYNPAVGGTSASSAFFSYPEGGASGSPSVCSSGGEGRTGFKKAIKSKGKGYPGVARNFIARVAAKFACGNSSDVSQPSHKKTKHPKTQFAQRAAFVDPEFEAVDPPRHHSDAVDPPRHLSDAEIQQVFDDVEQ